jgi:hypothetical protein
MVDFKLNQMTHRRIQLNLKNLGKVEIKSNDWWQTSISSKMPWQS